MACSPIDRSALRAGSSVEDSLAEDPSRRWATGGSEGPSPHLHDQAHPKE